MRAIVCTVVIMAGEETHNQSTTTATIARSRRSVIASLRWQAAWNQATPWLIAGGTVAAASVIIMRQVIVPLQPALSPLVPVAWAIALIAGSIPLLIMARRQPSELRVAQALESWGRGDGFLALSEEKAAAWQSQRAAAAATVTTPPLTIPQRPWLAFAALAALACWLVPTQPPSDPQATAQLPIASLFEPAQERLQELTDLGLLTEPEHEVFQERLQPLLNDAQDGRLDPGAWQAFERWQAAAEQQAADRQAALQEATNALNNHEHAGAALTEALRAASNDQALFNDMAQQLADNLAQQNQQLGQNASAAAPPQLTPEQAEQLRQAVQQLPPQTAAQLPPEVQQALRENFAQGQQQLNQFNQQQLANAADALREHMKNRQQQAEGKSQCPNGNCQGGSCPDGSCPGGNSPGGNGQQPGEGWGLSRGPGEAPLNLTNDSDGTAGDGEGLTQGTIQQPTPGILLATSPRAPDASDGTSGVPSTSNTVDQAIAQSRRTPIPPRHRATVGRYFSPEFSAPAQSQSQSHSSPQATEVP